METLNKIILIKNVSVIRSTYQIRLLAFKAVKEGKKLVIIAPKICKVDHTFRELMEELPKTVFLEKAA